jgi:hypothetical protein
MNDQYLSAEQIKLNYQAVLERIQRAADFSGRNPKDVKLVVVSKEKSINTIGNAIKAGLHIFGENYADHAMPKIKALRQFPEIQWHMIGHVQSRKAPLVVEYFDYLHSLDSVKLAKRLDGCARNYDKLFPTLIEFNLSGEESKFGFRAWEEEHWEDLIPSIEEILALSNIRIQGIMTIPPYSADPKQSRPFYKLLVRLQNFLKSNFPQACWSELSMGMSSDFEIAIEEGATWVRVGQAILGPRD